MNLISFDQSLCNTGYSVIHASDKTVIKQIGVIKTTPKQTEIERIDIILESIKNLICVIQPDKVCLEKVFTPRNSAGSWEVLIKIYSLIYYEVFKQGIEIECISASNTQGWRNTIGLKLASKKEVQAFFLPLKLNEHEADSLAIAFASMVKSEHILVSDIPQIVSNYVKLF